MKAWSLVIALPLVFAAPAANAELAVGAKAPQFTAAAASAGQVSEFSLADALQNGPVVLYFFPETLNGSCLLENYEFSNNIGRFTKAKATVVGIAGEAIDRIRLSSQLECSDRINLGC